MTDNELLLALSDLLETKFKAMLQTELQPIKDDIRDIKLDIENSIKPDIKLLAENYVPAAKKYEKFDIMSRKLDDIDFRLTSLEHTNKKEFGKINDKIETLIAELEARDILPKQA